MRAACNESFPRQERLDALRTILDKQREMARRVFIAHMMARSKDRQIDPKVVLDVLDSYGTTARELLSLLENDPDARAALDNAFTMRRLLQFY